MRRRVYIAIPTLDGRIEGALARLLVLAERANADPFCPWHFTSEQFHGYRPVDYMRNSIFSDFLASDADLLWMIDADILPPLPLATCFGILDAGYDITGGLVTGYKAARIDDVQAAPAGIVMQIYAYERRDSGEWDSIIPPSSNREVDAVGGGCMLIRREVIRGAAMDVEDVPPGKPRAIYRVRQHAWGEYLDTGDVDLCWRAKQLGYSVGVWAGGLWGQRETLDLRDVVGYGAACAHEGGAAVRR